MSDRDVIAELRQREARRTETTNINVFISREDLVMLLDVAEAARAAHKELDRIAGLLHREEATLHAALARLGGGAWEEREDAARRAERAGWDEPPPRGPE